MVENICEKSPIQIHEWVYPRVEDSIDKERSILEIYCKFCCKIKNVETSKDNSHHECNCFCFDCVGLFEH